MQLPLLVLTLAGEPPPYVEYALRELRSFCTHSPGIPVQRVRSLDREARGIHVLVGREAAERFAPELLLPVLGLNPELGGEGFILRVFPQSEPPCIVAAGWDWPGTRHAILELAKRLHVTADPPTIPDTLSLRELPAYPLRGMYAHQHWAYNYPYALRSWKLDDWKRYVDMLAYFRVNLFQIWSMAGMLPIPLSDPDRAYLEQYPAVIDHAQRNHNMEVWIGECANNVCDRKDVPPIAERLYFDVEALKNPADPKQMGELLANRRTFYTICDNADGYWILDSDPGKWPGSPASEFVTILERNRELIDECTRKGRDAKLIYWMWMSWGNGSREENWRDTARDIVARIHEPWWMTVAWEGHWNVAEKFGLLDRTVFYPYGDIEPEPSLPFTLVIPENLIQSLRVAGRRVGEIRGAMGNAQTPFVQLPNIYYFTRTAWDPDTVERERADSLRELARLLFPARAELLVRGWLSIGSPDAPEAEKIAAELESVAESKDLGRPGPVGLKLFPGGEILFADLAIMLRIHAAARQFCRQAAAGAPDDELVALVNDYNLLSVKWRRRNGFRRFPNNGYDFFPLRDAAQARWIREGKFRGDVARRLLHAVAKEHGDAEAEFNLRPLFTPVEKK